MLKLYIKEILTPIATSILLTSILVSIFMVVDGSPINQALSTGFIGSITILVFPILIIAIIHSIILKRDKPSKPKYRTKRAIATLIVLSVWATFWFIMGTYVDTNSWSGVIVAIFVMFSLFYTISSILVETVLHFIFTKPDDSYQAGYHTEHITD